MSRILLSYRREDSAADAGRIADRLRGHFGEDNVFIDIDTILPGDDFTQRIESSLKSCDALVAVIGRGWSSAVDDAGRRRLERPDDYVRLEIATALRRNIRVVPALVRDAVMPEASELPADLAALSRRQALEISDARFHHDVDRLIEALEATHGRPSPRWNVLLQKWRAMRLPGGWLTAATAFAVLLGALIWAKGWPARTNGYGPPVELDDSATGSSASPQAMDAGTIYKVTLDRYGEAYFMLSSPMKDARVTLDGRCVSQRQCAISTVLSVLDARGAVVDGSAISRFVYDAGFRDVHRLSGKAPEAWQLKLVNASDSRIDHWLTVSEKAGSSVPLFGDVAAKALTLDSDVTEALPAGGAAYFRVDLKKGEYTATLDLSPTTREPASLSGSVTIVNEDGGKEISAVRIAEYRVSSRVSSPVSLGEDGSYGVRVQNRSEVDVNYVLRLSPR